MDNDQIAALKRLREPFKPNQISKLPKPTKAQTEEVKRDFKAGIRCGVCQGWHHPKVVHLDYVGHAALTDRLLEVDPMWSWSFLSVDERGLPVLDNDGGMWINLTVCGVTRLGYGDAQGKTGGDATKERIGDALRNAAMRFGCALDLWHKGDLHVDSNETKPETPEEVKARLHSKYAKTVESIRKALGEEDLFTSSSIWFELPDEVKAELWVAPTKGGLFTTAERQALQSPEFRKAYYGDK